MQVELSHLPASIAECVADGILDLVGDSLVLTEEGAAMIAEASGWARGEDDDGDACFMHTGSYNTFSYVQTWRDLVEGQGLSPLSLPVSGVLAG